MAYLRTKKSWGLPKMFLSFIKFLGLTLLSVAVYPWAGMLEIRVNLINLQKKKIFLIFLDCEQIGSQTKGLLPYDSKRLKKANQNKIFNERKRCPMLSSLLFHWISRYICLSDSWIIHFFLACDFKPKLGPIAEWLEERIAVVIEK